MPAPTAMQEKTRPGEPRTAFQTRIGMLFTLTRHARLTGHDYPSQERRKIANVIDSKKSERDGTVPFLVRGGDPAGPACGAQWFYRWGARRTGCPPEENPKGRACLISAASGSTGFVARSNGLKRANRSHFPVPPGFWCIARRLCYEDLEVFRLPAPLRRASNQNASGHFAAKQCS